MNALILSEWKILAVKRYDFVDNLHLNVPEFGVLDRAD